MPLNKGRDIAVLRSANQVAFPVARNSAILDGWHSSLMDSIFNLAITVALKAGVLERLMCVLRAVRQQLLLRTPRACI
jgi:hypothetical protein